MSRTLSRAGSSRRLLLVALFACVASLTMVTTTVRGQSPTRRHEWMYVGVYGFGVYFQLKDPEGRVGVMDDTTICAIPGCDVWNNEGETLDDETEASDTLETGRGHFEISDPRPGDWRLSASLSDKSADSMRVYVDVEARGWCRFVSQVGIKLAPGEVATWLLRFPSTRDSPGAQLKLESRSAPKRRQRKL